MADIKVCDRCGKRLTEERSLLAFTPNRYTLHAVLFKKRGSHYNSFIETVKTTHDLCVDCTGELAKWLEYETSLEDSK